ncbi:hypothetical protein EG832_07790, partial [bacterium]|nr:hypothetical protein [bacterium]
SSDGLVPLLLNTSGLTSCKGHWDSFSRYLLIEQPDYPPGSLVISFEFPVGNSTGLDLKIDACSHCLFTTDMNAMRAILNLADSWRLNMDQYRTMLQTLCGGSVSGSSLDHHSFIGLGLSHGNGLRLNIYLKPSIKVFRKQQQNITVSSSEGVKIKSSEVVFLRSKAPTDDDLGQAVSRAVSFIIDSQSPAGSWLDFNLPVGPSDAWVTAYTGLTLSHLPDHLITEGVRNSLKRAREWLRASMHSDFGWGYNAFTESDSDSTAYALLFLKEAGISVPDSSYKFLKSFQKENGGFATYLKEDTNNSWGISHGDVTPVVLEALLGNNDTEQSILDAAHLFLLAQQDTSGPWHSFWWRSDLYCTMVNIRLFTRLGWQFRKGACLSSLGSVPLPDDPFELALLLRILTLLTDGQNKKIPNSELALLRLMNLQTSDGSWVADRILRLTSQNVKDPSFQEFAGDYYSDVCNTFTTSTVVESLISLMNERKAIIKCEHEPGRSRINSRGT